MAEEKTKSEKKKKNGEQKKRSFMGRVFRLFLWFGVFLILCGGIGLAGVEMRRRA